MIKRTCDRCGCEVYKFTHEMQHDKYQYQGKTYEFGPAQICGKCYARIFAYLKLWFNEDCVKMKKKGQP